MPPSQGTAHPLRLLGVYAALVAVMFGLIFFTGDKSASPKLGIDLQGGTRVTLTPRTPDGGKPSQDSLRKAQSIIEQRVNGLGVSGSEVVIEGDNLVITVPGEDGAQAKALATTAKMYIRPVLQAIAPQVKNGQPVNQQQQQQPQQPVAPPPSSVEPSAPVETPPAADAPTSEAPAPQNRVFPAQAPTTPSAPPTQPSAQQTQQEIQAAKALRQSTDPQIQQTAMLTMDCGKPDPLQGNDDPNLPLVTCSVEGNEVYLLDKSRLDGQEIKDASGQYVQKESKWVVSVDFKSGGADTWGKLTTEYYNKQLAFVLDTKVVSSPVVQQGGQYGGSTSISGQGINKSTAQELGNTLKYGSLPLSFQTSEAETVSATLGLSSLRAGLIAGAIGLVAVLLYCLLYYRMLGFLAGFSLVAAGVAVYALIVLLGRSISSPSISPASPV